ncbi:MAG: chorismate mutase [Cyanophyceae cyanobacterium]
MKLPEQCDDINEIRDEIDHLDHQIIQLLGKRLSYVKVALKVQNREDRDQFAKRFQTMLSDRSQWAEVEGINPDIVECVYRDLINRFIKEEMKAWQRSQAASESTIKE